MASPLQFGSIEVPWRHCGPLLRVRELDVLMIVSNMLIDFMAEHPEHVDPNNALQFLSDDGGETYNLCHCMYCLIDNIGLYLIK